MGRQGDIASYVVWLASGTIGVRRSLGTKNDAWPTRIEFEYFVLVFTKFSDVDDREVAEVRLVLRCRHADRSRVISLP